MITFTPESVIRSAELNANFSGLADGSEILDGAITIPKISNPYKFWAYKTSDYAQSTGKVNLLSILYDTNGDYDNTTNYRYNVPVDGYYQFSFSIIHNVTAGNGYYASIKINGSYAIQGTRIISAYTNPGGWNCSNGSGLVYCTAGQYVELYYQGDSRTIVAGAPNTFLSGYLVSET